MFVMDMPDIPPQYAPVVTAQASQGQHGNATADRTIGVCHLIENRPESRLSAVNSMEPIAAAWSYFKRQEHHVISDAEFKAAKLSLLQAPTHGTLEIDSTGGAAYFPTTHDYFGPDRATVLVEIGGYKVKVLYFFKVMQSVAPGSQEYDPYQDKKNCPQGEKWRMSLNPDDLNADLITFQSPVRWTGALAQSTQVSLNIADLPGTALGQTLATTITLDTNAADLARATVSGRS